MGHLRLKTESWVQECAIHRLVSASIFVSLLVPSQTDSIVLHQHRKPDDVPALHHSLRNLSVVIGKPRPVET